MKADRALRLGSILCYGITITSVVGSIYIEKYYFADREKDDFLIKKKNT